jgi:integrase
VAAKFSPQETPRSNDSVVSAPQLGVASNDQNKRDLVERRTTGKLSLVRAIGSSSERNSMARKRYQKGQLWLEEDGWHGRWREDVIVDGIRKRPRREEVIGTLKELPTKRLAQRALDERIAYVNKITYRPMPTAKFKDFADSWVKKVLSQYGESTAVNYRSHINKHLVPFFGQYSTREITPELVQAFVSSSSAAPKTTRNICITLQSMWRTAKAWGYSSCDIMAELVLPTPKRVQRFFFSQQEVRLMLSAAVEPYRTFYGLLAETGMRVGELCGLCVKDLDLVRGLLQVRKRRARQTR